LTQTPRTGADGSRQASFRTQATASGAAPANEVARGVVKAETFAAAMNDWYRQPMNSVGSIRDPKGIRVVYDGECPFCANYVRVLRLRDAVGAVSLVDARKHPELVEQYKRSGYQMDEGMVVEYGGTTYHGKDAMQILALLSSGGGFTNRILAALMRDHRRATALYPVFRAIRNATLTALGRHRLKAD
jgi:predicted DCC family thiol-disulfide oxidoreductase YuxK